MIPETIPQDDARAIPAAVRVLQAGGVLALPTETVYGLATLWDNAAGRERIHRLKRRPPDKRLQMLAAGLDGLAACRIRESPRLRAIAERCWPGPLTVIVPTGTGDTIGLRIPDHPFLLTLLKTLGSPLAATSANLSGMPPGLDVDAAVEHLDGSPDLLIDGGRATITGGLASTVVSLCGDRPAILREGPVSLQTIEECCRDAQLGVRS